MYAVVFCASDCVVAVKAVVVVPAVTPVRVVVAPEAVVAIEDAAVLELGMADELGPNAAMSARLASSLRSLPESRDHFTNLGSWYPGHCGLGPVLPQTLLHPGSAARVPVFSEPSHPIVSAGTLVFASSRQAFAVSYDQVGVRAGHDCPAFRSKSESTQSVTTLASTLLSHLPVPRSPSQRENGKQPTRLMNNDIPVCEVGVQLW